MTPRALYRAHTAGRSALVLALALAAMTALAACSSGGGTGDGGVLPDATDNLPRPASLTIEPATATVEIPRDRPATLTFRAVGHYADGSTRDDTARVGWLTRAPGASFNQATLSATLPGRIEVRGAIGSVSAMAVVTATARGDTVLMGVPAEAPARIAAATPTAGAVQVSYPLSHALFPANLGACEFQLRRSDPAQSVARLTFRGDFVDAALVAPCAPVAGTSDGCALSIPRGLVPTLAAASEGERFAVGVRLAAPDGTHAGDAPELDVRWTNVNVTGGLYYWSARPGAANGTTSITQFDLDHPDNPPVVFWTEGNSPALHDGTQHPCMGCHAISRTGTTMALTFGGSIPSDFAVVDIATRRPLAVRNTDAAGFATMSTFAPDGTRLVTMLRGRLTLRRADANLSPIADLFAGAALPPNLTHPFWSADGMHLAFTGYTADGSENSANGDLTRQGEIYLADARADGFATPRVLVPREGNANNYYPALSDDGLWTVYNRSDCSGPATASGYGTGACDGYNDRGARVRLVSTAGGASLDLPALNGTDTWTNSWPRFAPAHGSFRGRTLYWVAFSSKRPYGLRLAGSAAGDSRPQLWFAALWLSDEILEGDPSFAPVWLPGQNTDPAGPSGNHVPQWVDTAVTIENPG